MPLVVTTRLLARRGKPDALLHHSDQGSQYSSEQFQTLLQFVRHGTGNGEVTVVMASGVVLQGEYQVIQNASVGFGFAGGQTATALAFGSSPVSATAVGPDGTIMNCEAGVGGFGHGSGVSETNHGARYRVNF